MKTLAFCIPLFNFCEFFEKTFPNNHKNIQKYPYLSFSICVYGGNKDEFRFLIDNYPHLQKIKLKVLDNKSFNMSDAKNIAHLNADSDFVMNCDGDNFLSDEYLADLNKVFSSNQETQKLFIRCSGGKLRGRIGCWKSDFLKLGGYDSSRLGYWPDDRDLINRACKNDFNIATIPNSKRYTLEKLVNYDKVSNFS